MKKKLKRGEVYGYIYYFYKVKLDLADYGSEIEVQETFLNFLLTPLFYFIKITYEWSWKFISFFVPMPESGPMFLINIPDKYTYKVKKYLEQ